MEGPCISGYCVDWNTVGDVAKTTAAVLLSPLALLGGCVTTSSYSSVQVDGDVGTMDQSGNCQDSYVVESNARDFMKQICEPASYRIISQNANAFKCINGEFETKITFECYLP